MSTVRQYNLPHFETTVKMHLSREYLVEEKQVEPEVTLDLPLLFQCPATTTTKMTPPASCYGDQQKISDDAAPSLHITPNPKSPASPCPNKTPSPPFHRRHHLATERVVPQGTT